ncbi:MAG TPA: geranylgeranyl reductase family protein [Sphingobacteriaceae bacterium]|nr:geranylgeranyl reductase family protein [Sphingobacteriaceae bacterium]
MAQRFDAIVVGGGPGGATAARLLAQQGLQTLVLDAQAFPRPKVCGGGVTARTAALLADLDLRPVIDDTTYRFVLGHGDYRVAVTADRPLVFQVRRHRFDHLLLQAAQAAGAQVRTGEPVTDVGEDDDAVTVVTKEGRYRAPFLVAADGAKGLTARRLGAAPLRRWCGAVEWEYPVTQEEHGRWAGSLEFAFGSPRDGYAWVFPKKEHWSVGVCTLRAASSPLPQLLQEYMGRHGLDQRRPGLLRSAWPLAVSPGGAPAVLHTRRAVFVGDAAGLTDPFSGEGIYYAVASARHAAEVLARQSPAGPRLTDYAQRLQKGLLPELRWSWRLARTFYPVGGWMLRSLVRADRTAFAEMLAALARGDADYRRLARQVPGVILRGGRSGRPRPGEPAVEVMVYA